MKRYFIIILFMLLSAAVFSQEVVKNSEYYLAKSKNQKTAAWILFGGGTIMMITGVAIMSENLFTTKGTGLTVAGLLVAAGCIPLAIASGKNKRRAASLSFINMKTQQIKNSSIVFRPIPALSLKLTL